MTLPGFLQRRLPWVVSISLHGLLALFLLVNWPESKRTVVEPPAIRAVVLEKPKTHDRVSKPKPEPKAKPKPEPKPTPKPEPKPKPKKPAPKKPTLPAIAQPDLAAQIAQENIAMAAQQEALQEQQQEQKREDAAEQLEQDGETAAAVAAIKNALSAKWQRPPSARNGMEVLLQIQLLPGGEVRSVAILKSSGDKALDASAVSAVENASPLPVPSGELFDKFRKFSLRFRPEDLRL